MNEFLVIQAISLQTVKTVTEMYDTRHAPVISHFITITAIFVNIVFPFYNHALEPIVF